MKLGQLASILLSAAIVGGGCASMTGQTSQAMRAPQPTKPIDAATFYTGRWYEIGRTPMKLTDGCVAGTTDYVTLDGKLIDKDACHEGAPGGKEKAFAGPVTILDPGQNTKVRVDYKVFGLFTAPRTYWMLDHGDDWFIVSDPAFENVSVFTRAPRPSPEIVNRLKARVTGLGYDVGKLEYPAQFEAGS